MNTYKRHRFPPEVISCAVWFYFKFNMSHSDINGQNLSSKCGSGKNCEVEE